MGITEAALTTQEFLYAAAPKDVVVSVDGKTFGNPPL